MRAIPTKGAGGGIFLLHSPKQIPLIVEDRKNNKTMHKNKFINRSLYAVLTVGVSSALFSCQNDMHEDIAGNESDIVSFCIDKSSWGDASDTRSGSGKWMREIDRAVLRTSESNDTLCLRAIESDGIDLGPSVSTRGSSIGDVSELSSFGCFAYTEQSGYKFYINNEEYSKGSDGKFTSENIYYWPGVQQNLSLDFYCYAPYNCNGLTVPSVASESGTRFLEYAVPTDVSKQQDLMLADGAGLKALPSNHNQVLDLSFKHLLSAVRIETGSSMQAGTIKSITFSNLYGSANIDMDNPTAWTGHSDYKSFTFAPEGGVQVTGTKDQEIMAGANTMLMLPQAMQPETSLDPTMLTVVFNDGTGSQDRELTAELSGEWQMGRTYTYKLTITPEYELEFTQDNPTEVDAHYGIIPIKIKANELKEGWTVTSDQSWATLKSQLTPFEQDGYWLDNVDNKNSKYSNYCKSVGVPVERTQYIVGTKQGEYIELYLFVEENLGAERSVILNLVPNDQPKAKPSTLTITQKIPYWSNGIGWEEIEEDGNSLPYGFKWDRKVSYQKKGSWWDDRLAKWTFLKPFTGFWGLITAILNPQTVDYVTVSRSNDIVRVDIDYSKIENVSESQNMNDGQSNTFNLYTNSGGTSFNGELTLINDGYSVVPDSESGSLETVNNYAALYALKKNKVTVGESSSGGNTAYALIISQSDVKWYLPASGQFVNIPSDMNGKQYWSSTAINDNENAYSWNGAAAPTLRMKNLNVRAVRVKD